MAASADIIPARWETPAQVNGNEGPGLTTPGQILWLALLVTVVCVPHYGSVPGWVLLAVAATVTWRLSAALGLLRLPGTTWRAALTLAGSFAVAWSYRRVSGLDAGSALLILMLALKLLETRNARDRCIVILIAWFVLFAGFLREQSLVSVPQLAVGVLAGMLALLAATRTGHPLPVTRQLLATGRLLAYGLPLALALFLLFPRLPGPFWALPGGSGGGKTGLSDQMSPGDITALAQSDEVAFRVRFSGPAPRPNALYWRGPVLESFDGRRWRARPESARDRQPAPAAYVASEPSAPTYAYEIILEPHHQRWLLPLETPLEWDARDSVLTGSLELLNPRPIDRRLAWRGKSAAVGSFRDAAPPPSTRALPAARNPRTLAYARELRNSSASDAAYLRRILTGFREQSFYYTLNPPALGDNPVDEFLFGTRTGFCEHYASAFATLARAAGLPARIITGYQGGEPNPLADYWIVRQSDAHAWVEVWLDGRWVRYDPTAAVAPERVEKGIDAALPEASGANLPLIGASPWLENLALRWDAINATWDRWVLAFGPEQQSELMQGLGFRSPSLRDLALTCALTVSILLLLFTWLGLREGAPRRDRVEESWRRLCSRLARAARPRRPVEAPMEYARAVAEARPDLAGSVLALARQYLRLRYEGTPPSADVQRFARMVRRFRIPPAPARG